MSLLTHDSHFTIKKSGNIPHTSIPFYRTIKREMKKNVIIRNENQMKYKGLTCHTIMKHCEKWSIKSQEVENKNQNKEKS